MAAMTLPAPAVSLPCAQKSVVIVAAGGKSPAPPKPSRQPKAALQQHCVAAGLAPPQFAKLSPGGGRGDRVSALQAAASAAAAAAASGAATLAKASEAGSVTAAEVRAAQANAQALRTAAAAAAAAAEEAADPSAGLVRYSVVVAAGSGSGGGRGGGRKGDARGGSCGRKGQPATPRSFQLPEAADGWATINVRNCVPFACEYTFERYAFA